MKIDFSAEIKQMEPINTHYNGYWFRSRLEARWAVFLDEVRVKWGYEVQGFRLNFRNRNKKGRNYLPDFYLQDIETPWSKSTAMWIEIKGVMKEKSKKRCRDLAIESECPVLLIQGDPMDYTATLYRKNTPTQEVKFVLKPDGIRIVKELNGKQSKRLLEAQKEARSKRFES